MSINWLLKKRKMIKKDGDGKMKERKELKEKILQEKEKLKVVFALYYNVR